MNKSRYEIGLTVAFTMLLLLISACSKPTIYDSIPPAPTFDLSVAVLSPDSIMLTWTATGDDRYTGRASYYDIRYTTSYITPRDWDSLVQLLISPSSQSPGTPETVVVKADSLPSYCYFVLKTCDEAGNCSQISNTAGTIVVSGEEVSFPDSVLDAGIRYYVFCPRGRIYTLELEKLTELTINSPIYDNAGIRDLTGIEHCRNLRRLFLMGNQITDLSPLGNLTKLFELDVGHNQISDLTPLHHMTELRRLVAWFNTITDVTPLADLDEMNRLWMDYNQVSSVDPLRNLVKLEKLGFMLNQITDITALVDNPGLGTGDMVFLTGNPLTQKSIEEHLPALRARGVTVYF